MNRVCLTKDGKLIEMQSGGDDNPNLMEMRLNTLKQNALSAGYKEEDIEVKWVTDEEWVAIQEAQKDPIVEWNRPILAKLDEIDKKSIRAIRAGDTQYIKRCEEEAKIERAKLK